MTPRKLPKYEIRSSLLYHFFILTWLAGSGPFSPGEHIRFEKSFPKPLSGQLLKDRDKLSK